MGCPYLWGKFSHFILMTKQLDTFLLIYWDLHRMRQHFAISIIIFFSSWKLLHYSSVWNIFVRVNNSAFEQNHEPVYWCITSTCFNKRPSFTASLHWNNSRPQCVRKTVPSINSLWPSGAIRRQVTSQHWLRQQAITWTNVDLSVKSCGILPRALSWEDLKIAIS